MLLTGCIPTVEATTYIDHAQALGIRLEVIEDGPNAPDLWVLPEGKLRATPLPGDTVRLTPLFAGEDGPLDLSELEPLWIACGDPWCSVPPIERTCDVLPVGPAESCIVGHGPTLVTTLDDVPGRTATIRMVSGTPGGPTSEECLERLETPKKTEPLWDCVVVHDRVTLGPMWRLIELAADAGLEDHLDPAEIPPEARDVEPNVNPEVVAFIVSSESKPEASRVEPSARIRVRAGERVRVELEQDDGALQEYHRIDTDEDGNVFAELELEVPTYLWRFDAPVADPVAVANSFEFTPVEVTDRLTAYWGITDGRGGEVTTWLELEVVEP